MEFKDVDGIVWKDDEGKAHGNKRRQFNFNLDDLPLPAYHLIDMDHYLDLPKKGFYNRQKETQRSITFTTSRGCPENCCFCAVHLVSGKVWRGFSVNYVLDHMELLVKKYGVEKFHIEDDNFTLDIERARQIIEGVIERGLKIEWDALNGVRADKLDESLLEKMKKSGCSRLCISPESGNQDVLDNIIGKRLQLDDVVNVASICKKINLPLQAYFIIGFPGETKKTLQDTVDFATMLMRDYNVIVAGAMRATPFFGTRLYDMAKEKGVLKEPDPSKLDQSMSGGEVLIQTPEFGPEDLDRIGKSLVRATYYYSAKRYLKNPKALIKRFRNPHLIYSTIKRFFKGTHID